jgi:hypothetical protein
VSDIDTAAADSLKVLDPKRPIREADIPRHDYDVAAGGWERSNLNQMYWTVVTFLNERHSLVTSDRPIIMTNSL